MKAQFSVGDVTGAQRQKMEQGLGLPEWVRAYRERPAVLCKPTGYYKTTALFFLSLHLFLSLSLSLSLLFLSFFLTFFLSYLSSSNLSQVHLHSFPLFHIISGDLCLATKTLSILPSPSPMNDSMAHPSKVVMGPIATGLQ